MNALLTDSLTATRTEPDPATASRLTVSQDLRMRIARNDLERARRLDLAGTPPAELVLTLGSLTSSLYNVLQIVADLAAGAEQ